MKHTDERLATELTSELSRLEAKLGALSVAVVYVRDAFPILIAQCGDPITSDMTSNASLFIDSDCPQTVETSAVITTSVLLSKIDGHRSYRAVLRCPRKILNRKPTVSQESLRHLRHIVSQLAFARTIRDQQIIVDSISAIAGSTSKRALFKQALHSLLTLSSCSEGSIWEYHDNTAFGDQPFLTVEATANHDISVYDENCLPFEKGIVWDALAPGAQKIQYIEHVDNSRVVNRRIGSCYSKFPLSLFRLEADGSVYGVACLYGLSEYDLNVLHATFEIFEKLAALAIANKRLEFKAESLAGLRAVMPTASHPSCEAVCEVAAKNVRTLLNCQAVSVFLFENLSPSSNRLKLTAVSYDSALEPSAKTVAFLDHKQPVVYDINVQSLTTTVARTCRLTLANEVSRHSANSRQYREIVDGKNDTWIGVPIANSEGQCIGVLRCAGKMNVIDGHPVRYVFDVGDVQVLEQFSAVLSRAIETVASVSEWKRLNRRLALAEEIRGHEMFAPLLAISANARWVRDNLNDPSATSKGRRLLDIMTDAEMCGFLLRETNLPSEVEMQRDAQSVSINRILQKTRDFLMRRIYAKSPRRRGTGEHDDLGMDYDPIPVMRIELYGHSPRIYAHPMLLQRAFYNIAWNAVKYGKKGGVLKIATFADVPAKLVHVDFEDDGIGVEQIPGTSIFDEAVRGSNVPSDKYPGSGLGLYITREIVKRHGGSVELVSRSSPTKFRVTIPIQFGEV